MGLEKNKEHLFEIKETGSVVAIRKDFEEEWAAAQEVTETMKQELIQDMQDRETKTRRSRSASAVRNVPRRGVSRSLSAELATVVESPRRA